MRKLVRLCNSLAFLCAALTLFVVGASAARSAPASRPFSITRLDPALDRIVAPDAHLQLLGDRFGLVKGLQWINDGKGGYLIVSDLISNVLYKVAPDKTVSVFLARAGYTGKNVDHVGTQTKRGRAYVLLIGPSCVSLDPQGRLIWCANNDRALMRLGRDGARDVISNGANGKRFSAPNSVAITSGGAIYLTDNDFGLRGAGASPDKQMPNAVWLLRNGKTVKVLGRKALGGIPDGIALSPGDKWLYLSAGNKLKRYPVKRDGMLGKGTLFSQGDGIGDGIAVDVRGDVFSTGGFGRGRIRIVAPSGKLLGFLNLPVFGGEPQRRICSDNVAFGGPDDKTLYIAACEAVFKLRLRTAGVAAGPKGVVTLPVPKAP